jgi:hypothetical protein
MTGGLEPLFRGGGAGAWAAGMAGIDVRLTRGFAGGAAWPAAGSGGGRGTSVRRPSSRSSKSCLSRVAQASRAGSEAPTMRSRSSASSAAEASRLDGSGNIARIRSESSSGVASG